MTLTRLDGFKSEPINFKKKKQFGLILYNMRF